MHQWRRENKKGFAVELVVTAVTVCIGISAACLSQLAQCPALVFEPPARDCPDNNIPVLGFQDGGKTVWGSKWNDDIAGVKKNTTDAQILRWR